MICNPDLMAGSEPSAIESHIGAQIEAVCQGHITGLDNADEVARAIGHFLREEGGMEFVDSNALTLMAAQALLSLGERNAARRLVLFGTGMVRPSEWIVTGDRETWVLDLKEMILRDDAPLELVFFKGVQLVIESIADVWDDCRGAGTLGLRHICSAASALLGGAGGKSDAVAGLGDEIKDLCARKLEQIRERRGWSAAPQVMNLDI
jgi:hypothetical protein